MTTTASSNGRAGLDQPTRAVLDQSLLDQSILDQSIYSDLGQNPLMRMEYSKYVEARNARRFYGPVLIIGYVVLLGLTILIPLILFVIASIMGYGDSFATGLKSIQDFIVAMFAGLAGLSGLAGLVVGRFFQAEAEHRPSETSPGPSRSRRRTRGDASSSTRTNSETVRENARRPTVSA